MTKIGKKLMLVCMLLACALAQAATETRVLVVTQDADIAHANVLEYAVTTEGKWEYRRTFITGGDGHVRTPVATVKVGEYVYVAEYAGSNDGTAASIQKYDLDGNWISAFLPECMAWSNKLNRPGSMVSDGKYLYLGSIFNANYGYLIKVNLSTGVSSVIISGLSNPIGLAVSTSGRYLLVPEETNGSNRWGEIFDISDPDSIKHITNPFDPVAYANSAWYDDAEGGSGILYVGAAGRTSSKAVSIFPKDSTSVGVAAGGYNNFVCLRAIDGAVYAANSKEGKIVKVGPDGTITDAVIVKNQTGAYAEVWNMSVYEVPVPLTQHAKFNDAANAGALANEVAGGVALRPVSVRSGATDAVEGGAVMISAEKGRVVFDGSSAMIPATDAFSVFFWTAIPSSAGTSALPLFSNRCAWENDGHFTLLATNHKFGLYWSSAGKYSSISGADDICDGTWHHVGVVREYDTVRLYVDGVKVTEQSALRALAVSQSCDWTLGITAEQRETGMPVGTFFDEFRVYAGALDQTEVAALYAEGSQAVRTAPTAPVEPSLDDAVAASLGTVVAHRYAYEGAFASPSVLVNVNAPYGGHHWISIGSSVPSPANECMTVLYRSEVAGTRSWDRMYAKPALHDAVLHSSVGDGTKAGDKFQILGLIAHDGSKVMAHYDRRVFKNLLISNQGGSMTDAGIFTNGTDAVSRNVPALGHPAVANGRLVQSVLSGADDASLSLLSAAVSEAGLADWKATPGVALRPSTGSRNPFAGAGAGTMFAGPGNAVGSLQPIAQAVSDLALRRGPAYAACLASAGADSSPAAAGYAMLPGSDRPFSVRYDAASGLYWAVTAPEGLCVEIYSSPDLSAWSYRGEVASLASPVDANSALLLPVFDFSGDNLRVVYCFAGADGAAGARSVTEPNWLLTKAVAGFRDLPITKPGKKALRMLACDTAQDRLLSFARADDGHWTSTGDFAAGTALSALSGVASSGAYVFVSDATGVRRFFRKGQQVGFAAAPNGVVPGAIAAESDTTALVADRASGKIYRVANGWTELVTASSPISIAAGADGFYVVNSTEGSLVRYDSNGGNPTTVVTETGLQSVCVDSKEDRLYCGFADGHVVGRMLSSGESFAVCGSGGSGTDARLGGAVALAAFGSKPYIADASAGAVVSVGQGGEYVGEVAGFADLGSIAFVDFSIPMGLLLLLK